MMIWHLPSPAKAQRYRVENLYEGPLDDIYAQVSIFQNFVSFRLLGGGGFLGIPQKHHLLWEPFRHFFSPVDGPCTHLVILSAFVGLPRSEKCSAGAGNPDVRLRRPPDGVREQAHTRVRQGPLLRLWPRLCGQGGPPLACPHNNQSTYCD